MWFDIKESTGRARCCICSKVVELGTIQVTVQGYRQSGSAHYTCITKTATKIAQKLKPRKTRNKVKEMSELLEIGR